jgi:hypothetical protein
MDPVRACFGVLDAWVRKYLGITQMSRDTNIQQGYYQPCVQLPATVVVRIT